MIFTAHPQVSLVMSLLEALFIGTIIGHSVTMSALEVLKQAAQAQGLPIRAAYTLRQASRIVGIGRETLRQAVHRGDIRAIRVGRHIYIPAQELARVLEELREITPPSRP